MARFSKIHKTEFNSEYFSKLQTQIKEAVEESKEKQKLLNDTKLIYNSMAINKVGKPDSPLKYHSLMSINSIPSTTYARKNSWSKEIQESEYQPQEFGSGFERMKTFRKINRSNSLMAAPISGFGKTKSSSLKNLPINSRYTYKNLNEILENEQPDDEYFKGNLQWAPKKEIKVS